MFTSERILKFVNYVMKDGKKYLATRLVEATFAEIAKKGHKPEELFDKAIENVMPRIEVRPKRVGGSIYQVPQEVKPKRQLALAFRWILESARAKRGTIERLGCPRSADHASSESGNAFKKKLEVYKQAEANKAFARFAAPKKKI